MDKFVGLGEIVISSNIKDVIKTFALASCVGLTAYCKEKHIGGMIHIVLPECPDSCGLKKPCYYASTGVPLFIRKLIDFGCSPGEFTISVFGGAARPFNECFNIGNRNLSVVQKILKKLNVSYRLADVGGFISRTLYLDIATGKVTVNTLPIEYI